MNTPDRIRQRHHAWLLEQRKAWQDRRALRMNKVLWSYESAVVSVRKALRASGRQASPDERWSFPPELLGSFRELQLALGDHSDLGPCP